MNKTKRHFILNMSKDHEEREYYLICPLRLDSAATRLLDERNSCSHCGDAGGRGGYEPSLQYTHFS
jgi:hypothetical protein